MPNVDLLIMTWDESHRELAEAFIGLTDEDVWRRPHPALLSIGELAGHITYWEAVWVGGLGLKPNVADLPIKSPLIDEAFRYYTSSVGESKSLSLGAQEVLAEVKRVHEEAKAAVIKIAPDSEDKVPGLDWGNWANVLQYRGFHVAYHTGQAYSVRHLFGHETADN